MKRIKKELDELKLVLKMLKTRMNSLENTLDVVATEKGEVIHDGISHTYCILSRLSEGEFSKC